MKRIILGATALCLPALMAEAQDMMPHADHQTNGHMPQNAMDGHPMHSTVPNGIMGAHVLPKGKVAVRYTYGHGEMSGLRDGNDKLSPSDAVTHSPNVFYGQPMQPKTLRVVPHKMTMDMHMFSAMLGATDRVTLMGMLPYIKKTMTAYTYKGPVGDTVLGRSKRKSEGIGDIRIGAIVALAERGPSSLIGALAVSLPTGSITKEDHMLTPMNTTPKRRLAYMMQLGTGTVDLHPALTWQTQRGGFGFGAQARGVIHLGTNDEDYTFGDEAVLNLWTSYRATKWLSLTGRVEGMHQANIRGRDREIAGPAPGANPAYYGRDSLALYAGVELAPKTGMLRGHKLGIEAGLPVYEDLNGVGLKRDWSLTVAWRKVF